MFKQFVINLLFRLLGNSNRQLHKIGYLFGVSTTGHAARKKKWENALIRLWKDKDLLDYLYYQAESDKENYFQGKVAGDLSRGARIRTLFLIYSARRAYDNKVKDKVTNATDKAEADRNGAELQKVYKDLTNINSKIVDK